MLRAEQPPALMTQGQASACLILQLGRTSRLRRPKTSRLFFYRLKMSIEKTKHQLVMLGRAKDFVYFYLEAQSAKIEKRET